MRPLYERLSEATRLTRSGDLKGAVASIQAELAGGMRRTNARPGTMAPVRAEIVRTPFRELDLAKVRMPLLLDPVSVADSEVSQPSPAPKPLPTSGQFLRGRYSNEAGTRDYRLFVPPTQSGKPLPLVVMLHGCTQDPDAFAAGTAMNEIAAARGFYALYPAQAQSANANRCWNWFERGHQQRDAGEPAILSGMTREVMKQHEIDPRRIYVAGLSAGGAMAVILGDTYPDLYSAVGVHSGLPSGVAHDLPSALAAMKGSRGLGTKLVLPIHALRLGESSGSRVARAVPPTIVFHGDHDNTVGKSNADQIVAACLQSARGTADAPMLRSQNERQLSNNGRGCTRTLHFDGHDRLICEQWSIQGAGHAWSGGRKEGSYTDPRGPNASEEMIRFFFSHQLPA